MTRESQPAQPEHTQAGPPQAERPGAAARKEHTLLVRTFGQLTRETCDTCEHGSAAAREAVREIGGDCYCSAKCGLTGLPEGEWANFTKYLGDLRLKVNLLDVYGAVQNEPVGDQAADATVRALHQQEDAPQCARQGASHACMHA